MNRWRWQMPSAASQAHLPIIFGEVERVARQFVRGQSLPRVDLGDVRQDLLVDLFSRMVAFDARRGSIGAFANMVMINRARRLAQQLRAHRRIFGSSLVSIDDHLSMASHSILEQVTDSEGYSGMMGHHTDPFATVERRLDVETMLSVLPEKDAKFCRRLMCPRAVGPFPHNLMPRATAYRQLARIRRVLIANGFGSRDRFDEGRVEVFMDGFPRTILVPGSGTTSDDFKAWLDDAKPGAVFVYHCGSIALATNSLGEGLDLAEKKKLAHVADCAWLAAVQGRVHLLQRREGDGCFTYLAVARPRPICS